MPFNRGKYSAFSVLCLVFPNRLTTQIFFESNETLEDCHVEIKRLQGFSDLRAEYKIIKKLSKGDYPCVLLARHKKSKIEIVLKMIS